EPRHFDRIEAGKGPPIALALLEDGVPTEARLGPLQDEHLEQMPIVAGRHPPFRVVIGGGEGVPRGPRASGLRGTRHRHTSIPPIRTEVNPLRSKGVSCRTISVLWSPVTTNGRWRGRATGRFKVRTSCFPANQPLQCRRFPAVARLL